MDMKNLVRSSGRTKREQAAWGLIQWYCIGVKQEWIHCTLSIAFLHVFTIVVIIIIIIIILVLIIQHILTV